MTLLLIALLLVVGGGISAIFLSFAPRLSSLSAVAGMVAGAILGEAYAIRVLLEGRGAALAFAWHVPYGQVRVAVDPLSAFFLVPIFALAAMTAVYGRAYWMAHHRDRPLGLAWFAFNLLVASMVVVVTARQALLFLVAWEVMSICAYLLVALDHEREDVRRAGWVYLVATHVATAFLLALFLLLGRHAQSFDFDVIESHAPSPGLSIALFGLTLVGFGVKAGFVPLHGWIPEAHAAAPSHVSALMSGVLIKMGIYGLLRVFLLLGRPGAFWGPGLLAVGLGGAVYGISLALYQRDLKRVLAYSSIENMGLITLGLGMGLWGFSSGRPEVAVLATSGALLHAWNHTLMKGLMFLGAGSVLHGSGSKDLERLGGLAKRMPWTGAAMLAGAVAMSALPPMNGFVSEWLIYMSLGQSALGTGGAASVAASVALGGLALTGGLALLCFARLVGIALLGQPRTQGAAQAVESPPGMTVPLAILASLSAGAALAPRALARAASTVTAEILGIAPASAIPDAALATIGWLNGALWIVVALAVVLARVFPSTQVAASEPTWGCAYARPSERMQYTASSFSELLCDRLLPKSLRAHVSIVPSTALFPGPATLSSDASDPLTRGFYEPFFVRWGDRFVRLRWLQRGVLQVYLVYIVSTALLALAWISVSTWIGR